MTTLKGTKSNGADYSITGLTFIGHTQFGAKKFKKNGNFILLNTDNSIEMITDKSRRTMARNAYEA